MNLLHYQKHEHATNNQWIVFIHGAGGSIATWKQQVNDLKKEFNLLLLDLRDHGKSKNIEPPYKSYNFDIIAEDIFKVLHYENIEKAHFVTLSFGSVMMQALHQRKPDLVESMVMIGGIFNANWMIKGFVHLARFFNLFLSYEAMYRVFSFLLMPKTEHQVARRVYQMQARKLAPNEYLKWLGLYSEFFLLLKKFHQQIISQRLLILMGEHDYLFLPSAVRFAHGKTGAHLEKIPYAGHICNIDQPQVVNRRIMKFLNAQRDCNQTLTSTVLSDTN